MKRQLLTLKARISPSDQRRSKARPDRQPESLALDNARTVFLLVSNLGSGSLNVPGLQAAGQLGIQIIDIIKVVRLYIPSDIPLTNSSPENKREQGRL